MKKASLTDILSGSKPSDETEENTGDEQPVFPVAQPTDVLHPGMDAMQKYGGSQPTIASVTQPVNDAGIPEMVYGQGRVMEEPSLIAEQSSNTPATRERVVAERTPVGTPEETPVKTTVPQMRERINPNEPVTQGETIKRPYNADRIADAKAQREALETRPVNRDKGVRGFLKELFENVLWGISETYKANPNTPWQALLMGGAAAGGIGAFKRDFNELRNWQDEKQMADETLNREVALGDKELERDKRISDMENTRRDNDRMEKAEQRRTEYQKRTLENAQAKTEQQEVKMWLNYISQKGYNPEKDKFIADFFKSKNIELEPVAGKAQPRVWVDGALMERDAQTGQWTFSLDAEGNPVFSQGKQLVPLQTSQGTFLVPQGQAGFGAIQNEGRIAAITNQQSQDEIKAQYDYENDIRKFNADQSKLSAAQTKALSEKQGYERQLAELNNKIAGIDPKKDYDGSERRKLEAEQRQIQEKINKAQAEADAASRQFELNLQNPPTKRKVPQYQTPNVQYPTQQNYTRAEIEARVKRDNPKLKGKELEKKITAAVANVEKAGRLKK